MGAYVDAGLRQLLLAGALSLRHEHVICVAMNTNMNISACSSMLLGLTAATYNSHHHASEAVTLTP